MARGSPEMWLRNSYWSLEGWGQPGAGADTAVVITPRVHSQCPRAVLLCPLLVMHASLVPSLVFLIALP